MPWNEYEDAAEAGPFKLSWKIILLVAGISILVAAIGYPLGWFGEAAKVAREEFGPRASLGKYEWFKDAAAQLQKKEADIAVYEARQKEMNKTYENLERQKWPREDREQFNLWSSELAGVKASYNLLAAEYNAQMQKFNWKFASNDGTPREFVTK